MTEYIEQTSASDRHEAARRALAKLEWWPRDGDHLDKIDAGEALADALSIITAVEA